MYSTEVRYHSEIFENMNESWGNNVIADACVLTREAEEQPRENCREPGRKSVLHIRREHFAAADAYSTVPPVYSVP